MRVAIIGAGVSGLSCALELEKNGIMPVIYEKKNRVGEPSGYSILWSKLIIKTQEDPIEYLKERYDLKIKPLSRMNETIMISPKKRTVARGDLGYTFRRGVDETSLENQLLSMIRSPILYNSFIQPTDIEDGFDRIVIANADSTFANHYGLWTNTFHANVRVAHVLGKFKLDSVKVWFNEEYANKAFCYMIPNSTKEATLSLIVNDSCTEKIEYYWNKFISTEGIDFTVIEQSDMKHFIGIVNPVQINNLYFIGTAAGFTDDLIGIGGFSAIESGILAAQAIVKNMDYSMLVKPIYDDIKKLHEFRIAINKFDNIQFDRLIAFVGLPGIKQFIFKNSHMKLRYGKPLVQIYNKLKENE